MWDGLMRWSKWLVSIAGAILDVGSALRWYEKQAVRMCRSCEMDMVAEENCVEGRIESSEVYLIRRVGGIGWE